MNITLKYWQKLNKKCSPSKKSNNIMSTKILGKKKKPYPIVVEKKQLHQG